MAMKKKPYGGDVNLLLDKFTKVLQKVTGGDVLIDYEPNGSMTIWYESDPQYENKCKEMDERLEKFLEGILPEEDLELDLDEILKPNAEFISQIVDSAAQNNVQQDEC